MGQPYRKLLGDNITNLEIPQLFHQWRAFTFDENTGTVGSYITKISQCVAVLNNREPQILELFKNTLPSRLYWVLFPTDNLRDAIARAKRVLTNK